MDLGARLEVIERLSRLRDEGALTDEEFDAAKAKVLSGHAALPVGSDENEPASEHEDQSHGYHPARAPKWVMGATVLAVMLVAAFFVMKPQIDGTNNSSISASSMNEQPIAEAEQSSPQPTETDAALDAAANAVETAGAAVEAASQETSAAEPLADSSTSSDWRGKEGRCRLAIGGKNYIDGRCWVRLEPDGSFQIMSLDEQYFAQLLRDGPGGVGHWNKTPGSTHAHTTLGNMTRNGACWSNAEAAICAWAA